MNKLCKLLLASLFSAGQLEAQNKDAAEKLVNEGVAYHDKGDYIAAIAKYDRALELDSVNLMALSEKAYSLSSLQKFDDAIRCCRKAIEKHPGDNMLANTYVTYGNALDLQNKTDECIAIYDEGIKHFDWYYQLHYNKGITLSEIKKFDEASKCFETSLRLKPNHPGSHNAMARIMHADGQRITALLAYLRFMVLEPNSKRANENIHSIIELMGANVEQSKKNSVTIRINSDLLTQKGDEKKENNFNTTDLLLSMDAALDFDKKHKKQTEYERFERKFETLCSSLAENVGSGKGFFWTYYAPYFISLKQNDFIKTYCHIAYLSMNDDEVNHWLKKHQNEIDNFYAWSKNFNWPKN